MGIFDFLASLFAGKSDEQLEWEAKHAAKQLEKKYIKDSPKLSRMYRQDIERREAELDRRRGK